jgi:acetylornithine deacetylase
MLVAEPTMCTPVTGHKGSVQLEFAIDGVAAHSSKPHLGKNAIVAASALILRMYQEHEALQGSRSGPLGAPTLTPTLASGGHGPNIVPQDARVFLDYRVTTEGNTTESESTRAVIERLTEIGREVLESSEHCQSFTATEGLSDVSFYQDPDAEWVRQLEEWSGLKADVVTFGTNATAYSAPLNTGIIDESVAQQVEATVSAVGVAGQHQSSVYGTCVVMGPGDIAQAHMADEWIEISQLLKMKQIIEKWFGLPTTI